LDLTMRDILEADGAQRLFVITGDSRLLQQYSAAIKKVDSDIAALRADPNAAPFREHMRVLDQLLHTRLASLQEAVALRQEEGFSAAWKAIVSRENRYTMAKIASQSRELETLA